MGSLIVCWVVLPLLFGGIATGWGWIARRAGAIELPGALLPLLGFAALTVVAAAATATGATAKLAFPVVAVGGLVGLIWLWRSGEIAIDPWALGAFAVVYVAYAAPIVLSGDATFAGFYKLDDDSTWFALTDRMLEHGRNTAGLAPSTYQLTLAYNLGDWYPVGVFPPLGIASRLVHEDVAWVIQPYMAMFGASLALAFTTIARPLVGSRRLAALVAVIAAQPALLVGYYLWGGIKELASAPLVVLAAVLAADAAKSRAGPRQLIPLGITSAALVTMLTLGGAVWVAPLLIGALLVSIRDRWPAAVVLKAAGACAGIVALFSLPVLLTGGGLPPTSSDLDNLAQLGNLAHPLDYLQAVGIWPSGDFRFDPGHPAPAYALIAVAIAAALFALWRCWDRGDWRVVFVALAAIVGTATIVSFGSPWVDGKALAVASPAALFLAALGGAMLIRTGRRAEGIAALALIAAGVLWSNALAYREVDLAPRAQLRELQGIGDRIEGEGPTLITEFQPYGARHFLRAADAESASELRYRRVPLRDGSVLGQGGFADTDELAPAAFRPYRTVVIRRSPAASRPRGEYRLIGEGRYYEVWQRPAGPARRATHLPLGPRFDPTAPGTGTRSASVPRCSDIRRLARIAGPAGTLFAAPPRQTAVVRLRPGPDWSPDSEAPGAFFPAGEAKLRGEFTLPRAQTAGVWVRGSSRSALAASIDGRPVGSVRGRINYFGQYMELGSQPLAAGRHELELSYAGPDLHPGSAGDPFSLGPAVIGTAPGTTAPLRRVSPGDAAELCGRQWDWVEAAPPPRAAR